MKFTCEKCGRSYVADEKVRGRAFKMKCKQCGQLIVVKPDRSAPTPTPGSLPAVEATTPTSASFSLDPPADPFAPAPAADPFSTPAADPFKAPSPDPFATASPPPPPAPRPAFDPFADVPTESPASAAKATGDESEAAFADLSREMQDVTNNIAVAPVRQAADPTPAIDRGRRSPPAPVPAPLIAAPAAPAAARSARSARPAAPAPGKKSSMPLIAGGAAAALVLAGVAAYALMGGKSSGPAPAPAPRPPPVAAARPQAPAPVAEKRAAPPPSSAVATAPVEAPAAAPFVAAPAPAAAPVPPPAQAAAPAPRPAKLAKAPEKPAPALPRRKEVAKAPPPAPARAAPPPPVAAPAPAPTTAPAPAPEPRVIARYTPPPALGRAASVAASAPSSGGGEPSLDQAKVDAAFASHRAAFDACLSAARHNEPNVALDGRTVNVTMTVNPNGHALYPTLDDVELNGTNLGECLKNESGKIRFPSFGGDAIRVRKPIVLK